MVADRLDGVTHAAGSGGGPAEKLEIDGAAVGHYRPFDRLHGSVDGDVADSFPVATVKERESLVSQERVVDVGEADTDEGERLALDLGDLLERSGDPAGLRRGQVVELVYDEQDAGAAALDGGGDERVELFPVRGPVSGCVLPGGPAPDHRQRRSGQPPSPGRVDVVKVFPDALSYGGDGALVRLRGEGRVDS